MIGFGIGPVSRLKLVGGGGGGGGSFSPASLFASGEQGFWYDLSDLSAVKDLGGEPIFDGAKIGTLVDKSGRTIDASGGPSAPTYRAGGGKPYAEFNGSSTFLSTNSLTPSSGFVQVFAAIMKSSDTAVGTVVGWTNNTAANSNVFHLKAPRVVSAPGYGFQSKGSLAVDAAVDTGFGTGVGRVVTGLGSLTSPYSKLRVGGAEQANVTTAQNGTTYVGPQVAYIGAQGSSSEFFNGRLYGLIVRFGPELTTQQISDTEAWLAAKM